MSKTETILILDFGSQYTQLIARRVRENKVFSLILPYNISIKKIKEINPNGIIFSGGPSNVYQKKAPFPREEVFSLNIPILGICYGMQLCGHMFGGKVKKTPLREYGHAELTIDRREDLFFRMPKKINVWMSHGDHVSRLPTGFERIAHTRNSSIAAFRNQDRTIFGIQFHPEVVHTPLGSTLIANFLFKVCNVSSSWTPRSFIKETVKNIRREVGREKVILGLSGGVDSSIAALLIHKAIGKQLTCIFVDNGVLRHNEAKKVKEVFQKNFHLNLRTVNAEKRFLDKLKNVVDPERKRKVIGHEFIRVFEKEAQRLGNVRYLAQGTLYPDVIESVSFHGGPTSVIKSHHNVGGLPKKLKLKLIEPLRELFKDEVREVGRTLGLSDEITQRQPFPGPGLAVRIIGNVTKKRADLLRAADCIVVDEIKRAGLYKKIWQSFAILLPIKSVGVMGDERTYENVVTIRAVTSRDGMTADWARLPYEVLNTISNRIINEIKGINRVCLDVSSKPPATIEWE
ncbi:MAG: glutamine-hydrolyzing GMP synthase [Candidatus Omnitrophica bacterium]|nr:glutamine-hydrolyzing GMP synthase [Candidatus Omnitrophota bacterium]